MLKLYTIAGGAPLISDISQTLLLLEEITENYQIIELNINGLEHKSDEFIKLSPFGILPCLIDNDFIIWNSLGINTYLAEKYKPELIGTNIKEKSLIRQWVLWSLGEFQANINMYIDSSNNNLHEYLHLCKNRIMKQTIVLDQQLKSNKFIVGNNLSIADLHILPFANIHTILNTNLTFYPNFRRWFKMLTKGSYLNNLYEKNLIIQNK